MNGSWSNLTDKQKFEFLYREIKNIDEAAATSINRLRNDIEDLHKRLEKTRAVLEL